MRTPNCECVVCKKPLYRRPNELEKVRHVACMEHRAEAQKLSGITAAQKAGLSLGRRKGTNNRTGYRHRAESKIKASVSHKIWCADNPEKVAERGAKCRGERHYNWKGGASKLSQAIRLMTEYRKWAESVKARDLLCVRCGSGQMLESHHSQPFADILRANNITSTSDARECGALWDKSNGITLCEECHYNEHGRNYENRRKYLQEAA